MSEGWWDQEEVRHHCKVMIARALRRTVYEESHSGSPECGQPIAQLDLSKDVRIDVLLDTGCMPSGLMTWEKYGQLKKLVPAAFTEPVLFGKDKVIAGVGDKVASVTAATTIATTVDGRPVIVCVHACIYESYQHW